MSVHQTHRTALQQYSRGFNCLVGAPQHLLEQYFRKVPKDGFEQRLPKLSLEQGAASRGLRRARSAFLVATEAAGADLAPIRKHSSSALQHMETLVELFQQISLMLQTDPVGAEASARLAQFHEQFLATEAAYQQEITQLEVELQAAEGNTERLFLSHLRETDGKSYRLLRFMIDAKALVQAVDKPANFATQLDRLSEHQGDLQQWFLDGAAGSRLATFRSQAAALIVAADMLKQERLKPAKKDPLELRQRLVDAYNRVTITANLMREPNRVLEQGR